MYVRISVSGGPLGDAEVQSEQMMIWHDDARNKKILEALVIDATAKIHRVYELDK